MMSWPFALAFSALCFTVLCVGCTWINHLARRAEAASRSLVASYKREVKLAFIEERKAQREFGESLFRPSASVTTFPPPKMVETETPDGAA